MDTSAIGKSKWDLDTPVLVVDLDLMEENIRYLASYMKENGKHWRPHCKAHKTPAIAHKQIAAGAIGITCAKLGEAEVMVASGIKDILIGNQVVGRQKVERLASLQKQARVMAAVDGLRNIREISQVAQEKGVEVPLVIEVNSGLGRCGVEPGGPVLELAREIVKLPGLAFQGLFTWEGFVLRERDFQKRTELVNAALKVVVDSRKLLEDAGIRVSVVSVGGTGDYIMAAKCPGVTEIQAGGGCFMDLVYSDKFGHVGPLKHALTIISTVASKPNPDRAICDAGRKSMSDQMAMPKVVSVPGADLHFLSAEHGTMRLTGEARNLEVGDKVEIIPGYSDTTIFLYDEMYGVRDGRVETVWPILARGRKD